MRNPDGNHGDNKENVLNPQNPMATPERSRLSLDVSEIVSGHLDHISQVTGVSKAQIVVGALLDALPDLLARADGLKARHQQLQQGKRK